MVNVIDLKKGDFLKALISNDNGITKDKIYTVKEVGRCRWTGDPYADINTDYPSHIVEISIKNCDEFKKI